MHGQMPDFSGGMDFLKTMWANVGMPSGLMPGLQGAVPGFAMPPMDLDELDKRIADLKSVESWLSLNLNMLRTTIQGLEVQRATLVAVKTFAGMMAPEQMREAMAKQTGSQWPSTGAERGATDNSSVSDFPASPAAGLDEDFDPETDDDMNAPPDDASAGSPAEAPAESVNATDAAAAAAAQAGVWWNVLHDQFSQIANSAVAASQIGKTLEPMMAPLRDAAAAMTDAARVGPEAGARAPDKATSKSAPKAALKSTSKPAAKAGAAPKPAGAVRKSAAAKPAAGKTGTVGASTSKAKANAGAKAHSISGAQATGGTRKRNVGG